MHWYVLRAVSGKEAKLKEYIEAEMKHNDLHLSLRNPFIDIALKQMMNLFLSISLIFYELRKSQSLEIGKTED